MRGAFTLVELIFVIAVSSVLAIGTFKAIGALYVRSAKAQALTDMSLSSQIVLDEISLHLYNRIPNSVIGYDIQNSACSPISDLVGSSYSILEWLATMDDEMLERKYDGFIDMGDSNRTTRVLSAKNINTGFVNADVNLVFSGAFDAGTEESTQACAGAFGWHGNDSQLSYDIAVNNNLNKIVITDALQPEYIYEKYYLTKSAYAIARGADLDFSDIGNCNSGSYVFPADANFSTTLFLFYEYQPFRGETFCGDKNGANRAGKVSILAEDVSAFQAEYVNETIKINLDMNRSIRGSSAVFISKQKAIF